MQFQEDVKQMEFLLTLDGFIIIQRFYNVHNYNPNARYSWDLYETIKKFSSEISDDLVQRNFEYMSDNQELFYGSEDVGIEENWGKQNFLLVIRDADEVFISRTIPAYYFHPKVRYTVDIRPKIGKFLSKLTKLFSSNKLTTTQYGYDLNVSY